jgi:hypothetical protein
MPDLLEVGIPDALGLVIRVADVISDVGSLPAEFTYSAHNRCFLSAYFELDRQLILTKDYFYQNKSEIASNNEGDYGKRWPDRTPAFHVIPNRGWAKVTSAGFGISDA